MNNTSERLSLEQLWERANSSTVKRNSSRDIEHHTQVACVRWFRMQYPEYAHALFAVPNGGRRDAVTGARLKAEGVIAGVSDLIFLKSNALYGALLIEFKDEKGRQSPEQKRWQQLITADEHYRYVIVRSFDDFRLEMEHYLKTV